MNREEEAKEIAYKLASVIKEESDKTGYLASRKGFDDFTIGNIILTAIGCLHSDMIIKVFKPHAIDGYLEFFCKDVKEEIDE